MINLELKKICSIIKSHGLTFVKISNIIHIILTFLEYIQEVYVIN